MSVCSARITSNIVGYLIRVTGPGATSGFYCMLILGFVMEMNFTTIRHGNYVML